MSRFGYGLREKKVHGQPYPFERKLRFEWRYYYLDPIPSGPRKKWAKRKKTRRLLRMLTCSGCGKWYPSPTPTLACSPECRQTAIAYKRRKGKAA